MKSGGFLILLYHGVYPDNLELEGRNISGKHLPVSEFQRQMEVIRDKWAPVSMLDIAAAYRGEKELPPGAVVVTFDDGYRNVYEEAWPILQEMKIPFTVYLTTGWIGTGESSWADELESMFWQTEFAPCLSELKDILKGVPFEKVESFIKTLKSSLVYSMEHPLYQMLTWEMVQEMGRDPLVSFGAHTVCHAPLARVSYQRAIAAEIDFSLDQVSIKTKAKCSLFSYPEGQPGDFNSEIIAALWNRGVEVCPTAVPGLNMYTKTVRTDPMRLYRCAPGLGGQPFPLGDNFPEAWEWRMR